MQWQDYPSDDTGGHTVTGTLKVLRRLHSPQLDNERDILVYLPPSYPGGGKRYPVIYMHDGQNLFDGATSFAGEWHVDEAMEHASRAGLEALVVGVPNMGEQRCDEYSPFADPQHGGGRGDLYLDFLVDTLKPIIERDFATNPAREATGIAGSSMGGLISLYALFRNVETFGYAGAMSPALWLADRAIFGYVEAAPYVPGRIYLDVGTQEGEAEVADVRRMRELLARKGYREGDELLYVVEPGGYHREAAWARRLPREIRFFLRALSGDRSAPSG
jgi:predicted alpha/beta superfamily hydrolase